MPLPPAKKQKSSSLESLSENVSRGPLMAVVNPKTPGQRRVVDLWHRSRVLFLIGGAGTGKTHISLALALSDALKKSAKERGKIMLTRPMITVEEPIGYLPGTVDEKVLPWLMPFHDVLGQITFTRWEELQQSVDVESVPLGMLRGRTIRDGVLICDEMQNSSYAQIKCVLTRIGFGSKIVLCGDTDQSDLFNADESPLMDVANRLEHLDTVSVVYFDPKIDQVRDPLVSDILDCL